MALQKFQKQFKDFILGRDSLAPEGVKLRGNLNAYRLSSLGSLASSLRYKYQMTAAVLGIESFKEKVGDYILKNPLQSPFLCTYGESFFLCMEDPLVKEVARLEYEMNRSLVDYKEEKIVSSEILIAQTNSLNLSLALKAGVKLLSSSYDLKHVWACLKTGRTPDAKLKTSYFLISSEKGQSYFMEVLEEDYLFLSNLETEERPSADLKETEQMINRFHSYLKIA